MGKKSKPRSGSMQYYPRKRAASIIPKFRSLVSTKDQKEVGLLNFYGYKVGMLHVMAINKHKGSPLLNQKVVLPATVVEVPPITVYGVRLYGKNLGAKIVLKDFIFTSKVGKYLERRLTGINKAKEKGDLLKNVLDYFEANKDKIKDVVLIAHTHPEKTTIGKKKPEVLELHLSGNPEEQFEFFKANIGKDMTIDKFAEENSYVDIKGVTIGKGFQGVIKRFGVKRRHHKSEKGVRRVGSIGPWHPATVMSSVPRPGQMGFHNRIQLNQKILKVLPYNEINPKSGWEGYGSIKNNAVLVTGSVPGHVKRLVAFRFAERKPKDVKSDISEITNIVF